MFVPPGQVLPGQHGLPATPQVISQTPLRQISCLPASQRGQQVPLSQIPDWHRLPSSPQPTPLANLGTHWLLKQASPLAVHRPLQQG